MGIALGVVLIIVPNDVIFLIVTKGDTRFWPAWILLLLLSAFFIGLAASTYRRNRAALTVAACAYAFGWTALLQLFCGASILVTGRSPGRFSHSVPRSSAVANFVLAVCWLAIALGLSRWNAWQARIARAEDRTAESQHHQSVATTRSKPPSGRR